jgi:hypothetical protein
VTEELYFSRVVHESLMILVLLPMVKDFARIVASLLYQQMLMLFNMVAYRFENVHVVTDSVTTINSRSRLLSCIRARLGINN